MKSKEAKYRIFWRIGAFLSSIIYFSGFVWLYTSLRKGFLKNPRMIVLTYHRVKDEGIDKDISTSCRNFEKQMAFLKKHFHVISLDALLDNIGKDLDNTKVYVAITFDDGYEDNYLNAYPILKKYELPATIFLVSEFIEHGGEKLNAEQIKTLAKNGIEFGSHTVTHEILSEINHDEAIEEISRSKEALEKLLNDKIQFIAYPKGKKEHFNNEIKVQVEKLGYKAAFTTINGEINNKSDLFELKRIGIRDCPLFVFKVRVSGVFENSFVYQLRRIMNLN